MKQIIIVVVAIVFLFFVFRGCGEDKAFKVNPVDELVKSMSNLQEFTIILYDMDVEGSFSETYKHKYQIVKKVDTSLVSNITDWNIVDEAFFNRHMDDMGMEIVTKKDGKVQKQVSPPGYSNYVGNPQYGSWATGANGSSFWQFFGQYMFMSTMFNMLTMPAYRSTYDDYRGSQAAGRPYYGTTTNGQRMYGTQSEYNTKTGNNKQWFTKSSNASFRDRVRNRVAPSSDAKRTHSGTRYSPSSRSRSGGFGK